MQKINKNNKISKKSGNFEGVFLCKRRGPFCPDVGFVQGVDGVRRVDVEDAFDERRAELVRQRAVGLLELPADQGQSDATSLF